MKEDRCPVTGEQVVNVDLCRCCTIGRVYLCPIKQEIEAQEACQ